MYTIKKNSTNAPYVKRPLPGLITEIDTSLMFTKGLNLFLAPNANNALLKIQIYVNICLRFT